MAAPTVFFYNLDTPRGKKIKLLCLPLKLRVKDVSPAEYGETLAALAGLEERSGKAYTGQGFSEEMLVMAGLSGAQMNGFLQGFRKKNIASVALKAVATETNLHWTSVQLHDELKKEHEAVLRGGSAHEDQP